MILTPEVAQAFRDRPELWFEKVLGIKSLEDHHRRMLRAIAANERTAIAACHDVGKSWTLARVVLWFISNFPNSKAITTAPTYNQVKNILWAEIRTAHGKSKYPLGGTMNLTEWKVDDNHFAIGFTSRNEVQPEGGQGTASSFQGFHAEGGLLVVFDEATGIPPQVWVMAEGLLTQAHVKFVAIANPTSRNSEFFKCFRSRDWMKVYLSCLDSPNLKANGIMSMDDLKREVDYVRSLSDDDARARLQSYKAPVPYLLALSWVVRSILKWGWEHPLTLSKILGLFPEETENAVITLGSVEESFLRLAQPLPTDRKVLGVDVARFGTDSSVLTGLHGTKQTLLKKYSKRDLVYLTGEIVALARDENYDVIVVDETGLGAGVVDNLREAQRENRIDKKCEIRGVQFGAGVECLGTDEYRAVDCPHKDCAKARYVNRKAQMFNRLGEALKASDGLCLMNEECYAAQLPTILYRYDSKGRMYIESKDEYKKRTGMASPDEADSLALANDGRYDEIKVGTFSTEYFKSNATPMAGTLGDRNQW